MALPPDVSSSSSPPFPRPVKRAVQRELETVLAKALLRGDFVEEDTIVVEAGENGGALQLSKGSSGGGNGNGASTPVSAGSSTSGAR